LRDRGARETLRNYKRERERKRISQGEGDEQFQFASIAQFSQRGGAQEEEPRRCHY
jgi:hypothetical protein